MSPSDFRICIVPPLPLIGFFIYLLYKYPVPEFRGSKKLRREFLDTVKKSIYRFVKVWLETRTSDPANGFLYACPICKNNNLLLGSATSLQVIVRLL